MKSFQKLLPLYCIFIIIIFIHVKVYPEFLLDEEAEEVKEDKREIELPKDVVREIKAESITNIKGAIKISWKFHKDSDDDFIIGRSTYIPDTIEKVMKAISIKVVPAGAKPTVIDSNLPPGAYYYCILAKKKIMDKSIKLYPDFNYTTNPVIIEKEIIAPPIKTIPMQVTLIHARVFSKRMVLLTWRGIESRGIVYTIYRGNTQLDSPEKLQRAEKIALITDDRESFVDKTISKSGIYYYAVTTKNIEGNEDLHLIPDQSCISTGVYITIGDQKTVSNIQARLTDKGSIKISWIGLDSGISEYLLYRYHKPISDDERLALSTFVDRINIGETSYIDHYPGFGNHYYAILTKMGDGTINTKLIKGNNFISAPISTTSIGKPIQIKAISTEAKANKVKIMWRFMGNQGNRNYKIVRSISRIKTLIDVTRSFIVDYVNIFDKSYVFDAPSSGKYYYAIVPEDLKRHRGYKIIEGVNTTEDPVIIKRRKKKSPKLEIAREEEYSLNKDFYEGKWKIVHEVDIILQVFFFQGKYNIAIKELQDIIKSSDNEYEIAKAKYFIGRSLLEMKRYRKSIKFLLLPDVQKHFPLESKFWYEYAISKVN